MSDIVELERRITAALDRIAAVLDRAGQGGEELASALEAERTANAQLEERVRAIKEKQETQVASLEGEVARLRGALAERDAGLQRMRRVNAELRTSNDALRAANAAGLPDSHLVNKSMMAELEAVRAAADASDAEIAEILATLDPILKEAENA